MLDYLPPCCPWAHAHRSHGPMSSLPLRPRCWPMLWTPLPTARPCPCPLGPMLGPHAVGPRRCGPHTGHPSGLRRLLVADLAVRRGRTRRGFRKPSRAATLMPLYSVVWLAGAASFEFARTRPGGSRQHWTQHWSKGSYSAQAPDIVLPVHRIYARRRF
jgi:hypothetical protein